MCGCLVYISDNQIGCLGNIEDTDEAALIRAVLAGSLLLRIVLHLF